MFKSLVRYIDDKKDVISQFKSNKKYMSDGRYKFDNNLKYLYNVQFKEMEVDRELDLKILIKKFLNLILTSNLKINTEKKNFKGHIFIRGNDRIDNPDTIIMDYKDKIVLRINSNKQRYDKKMNTYIRFNPYYPIPKITNTDSKKLIIEEKMILEKSRKKWTVSNKNYIFNKACAYNKNYLKEESKKDYLTVDVSYILDSLSDNKWVKLFLDDNTNLTNSIRKKIIPYINLHGDYCFNNVLLGVDEKEIKVIDWEYSGLYSFTYDFFWLILSEAISKNDYTFINQYFKGDYDSFLTDVFLYFDLSYNKNDRLNYLYYAMLDTFYSLFIDNYSEKTQNIYLNHYIKILDRFS